ncbi:hypothetical protein MATL_G00042300 [Megalops atlanticus]|uniref:Uncharacterized protein n=1 Tax=Megalops atlanticus TaxID=7932 RepID=A0A9D3TGR1_MEGAT|nr:hypothetical protein MATL_G00042300 [Megalops atlanticus]
MRASSPGKSSSTRAASSRRTHQSALDPDGAEGRRSDDWGGIGYVLPLIAQPESGGSDCGAPSRQGRGTGNWAPGIPQGRLSSSARPGSSGHPSSCVCAVDSRSVTAAPSPNLPTPTLTPIPNPHPTADSQSGQIRRRLPHAARRGWALLALQSNIAAADMHEAVPGESRPASVFTQKTCDHPQSPIFPPRL